MRYKLTDQDYAELALLMSPEEIRDVFGERSKSPRSIRRLHSKWGLPSQAEFHKELMESVEALDYTPEEKKNCIKEVLSRLKKEQLEIIWDSVFEAENRWH